MSVPHGHADGEGVVQVGKRLVPRRRLIVHGTVEQPQDADIGDIPPQQFRDHALKAGDKCGKETHGAILCGKEGSLMAVQKEFGDLELLLVTGDLLDLKS